MHSRMPTSMRLVLFAGKAFLLPKIEKKRRKGSVCSMSWVQGDFSQYHYAEDAWYSVHSNGNVDIGMERGRDEKISLTERGMMRLVLDWLENMDHIKHLEREDREKVIKLLQEK